MAMAKKFTALLLSAVMTAGMAAVPAYAESAPARTVSVSSQLLAKTVEWDGKAALKKGTNYTVTKDVTVSKKTTVPAGVTLTVKDGAKLTIGAKGTLYIKGAVTVGKGSTLAVSGKLNLYKGKKLTITGTVKFGSKSVVTLSGKVTQNAKGAISGTPKKLTIGDSAVLSLKGKNTCAKLNEAVYAGQISDTMMGYVKTFINNDFDMYTLINEMFPKKRADDIDARIKAQTGMTLKQFCELINTQLLTMLENSGAELSDLKALDLSSATIKINDLENCYNDLDDDEKAVLKEYYDNTKIVYSFDVSVLEDGKEVTLDDFNDFYAADDDDDDDDDTDDNEIKMALVGKKWYMF